MSVSATHSEHDFAQGEIMPELPEVETVRRGLERLIVGRKIVSVDVRNIADKVSLFTSIIMEP